MPVKNTNRFLLLYGSQTGQAQAISEEIAEKAEREGLHAETHCLSLTEQKFNIEREKCVVFITSTTGDGDPPDTAAKFVRRLKKKTLSESYLSHLHYALLGLGDSNYTNFCKCGKLLEKRLTELGATQFYCSGFADDAVGLEVAVEPWMDGLFPAIKRFLNSCKTHCDTAGVSVHAVDDTSKGGVTNGTGAMETIKNCSDDKIVILSLASESKTAVVSSSTPTSVTSESKTAVVPSSTPTSVTSESKTAVVPSSTPTSVTSESKTAVVSSSTPTSITSESKTAVVPSSTPTSVTSELRTAVVPSSEGDLLGRKRETTEANQLLNTSDGNLQCPSLQHSVPPLSESSLTLPFLPPKFLSVVFRPEESFDSPNQIQNGCPFPSAASDVVMATVTAARRLTTQDAVKKTLLLTLDTKDCDLKCKAGDAISVICPNPLSEVLQLLDRLGLQRQCEVPVEVDLLADTKKRNAQRPAHVPPRSSLQHLLQTCVDVRRPPAKALLRCLVEFTSDAAERRRLQELCSRQGAADYGTYVRQAGLSLLDVLNGFPSCSPPIACVLEHLPRLQPRPYSICCDPASMGHLQICFNVVTMEAVDGRSYPRSGLCTGWLDSLTGAIQGDGSPESGSEVEQQLQALTVNPPIEVPVFARTNQRFHAPEDTSVPMILIGPGTGVAPFIGFLQQRKCQIEKGDNCGAVWLFCGCRHRKKDFLFRRELQEFQTAGVLTHLSVSVSREEGEEGEEGVALTTRYVQHSVAQHGQALVQSLDSGAVVYVCGDANHMAKDVNAAFCSVIQQHKGVSEEEALNYLMKMRLHKKYVEDVWT